MAADDRTPDEPVTLTVSERSLSRLAVALQDWLTGRLGAQSGVAVSDVRRPGHSGMSNTSVLFEAAWVEADVQRHGAYVARLAPEAGAVPVFPRYDLTTQFDVISQVAARSAVPVPTLRWNEPGEGALGGPFFVMDQVGGQIPLDNPPYVFTGWLLEAAPADRTRLQRATVEVLARLHGIADAGRAFPGLRPPDGEDALRRHLDGQREYYRWALTDDGIRVPIIERALDWLTEHWPRDRGPDVLSWGDARIGNIIYRDFEPVAVLDWEMAALGPRELDVAWFVFLHRFFQDIAENFGLDGLPDFLRRSEVEQQYQEMTGIPLHDMEFHLVYAALRHAIVMARVKRRMIHFGEDQAPTDPDDYVMHRAALERLLAGTYRWD